MVCCDKKRDFHWNGLFSLLWVQVTHSGIQTLGRGRGEFLFLGREVALPIIITMMFPLLSSVIFFATALHGGG